MICTINLNLALVLSLIFFQSLNVKEGIAKRKNSNRVQINTENRLNEYYCYLKLSVGL